MTFEQAITTLRTPAIPIPCDDGHLYGCPTFHKRVGCKYWCDACLANEAREIAREVARRAITRGVVSDDE